MIDWSGILNIVLGLYGAGLTTYTIVQQRKDKKPDIKVSLYEGYMKTDDDIVETYLFVKAANHGEQPTKLSAWQLVLPHKKQLIYPFANGQASLPYLIPPKESYQGWVPVKVIAESLMKHGYRNKVNVKAVYFDEIDKKYFSKRFEINIPEWKKG